MIFPLGFLSLPEGRYPRGHSRVKNNIDFFIGLLFVSLPCSRSDIGESSSVCVAVNMVH